VLQTVSIQITLGCSGGLTAESPGWRQFMCGLSRVGWLCLSFGYCLALSLCCIRRMKLVCCWLSVMQHIFRRTDLLLPIESLPTDDLIDWNSCLSVHRQKRFSNFDLIWYVGRPRPDVRTSMNCDPIQGQDQGH